MGETTFSDLLVVDHKLKILQRLIIAIYIQGELTIKRLEQSRHCNYLRINKPA